MKVLITGGAGFIGSHVAELFCNEGHDVTVIDDLSFGYVKFVDKRAKFINASLSDRKLLNKLLKGIDIVVHLAASSIIRYSFEDPVGYYQNNVINGLNLLEAMRENKVSKIIFSSSASVYGEPIRIPVKESDPTNPITVYGSSKLAFEKALEVYYRNFHIESVSLRYYNVYGPRDEQKPATRAIPMWTRDILNGRPIEWYWKGKQVRDYIYVEDVAKAHLAVLPLRGCNIFNIGSGSGILMKNVLVNFEKILGRKLKTKDLGERPGDPMKLVADISKIKKIINWEPRVGLEEGLRKTYNYFRERSGV